MVVRWSNLVPQKRKVEVTPKRELRRAVWAPTKLIVAVASKERDKDPKILKRVG